MSAYVSKLQCGISFNIFLVSTFWNILEILRILLLYSYFLSIYKNILYYNCLYKKTYDLNKFKNKVLMSLKS